MVRKILFPAWMGADQPPPGTSAVHRMSASPQVTGSFALVLTPLPSGPRNWPQSLAEAVEKLLLRVKAIAVASDTECARFFMVCLPGRQVMELLKVDFLGLVLLQQSTCQPVLCIIGGNSQSFGVPKRPSIRKEPLKIAVVTKTPAFEWLLFRQRVRLPGHEQQAVNRRELRPDQAVLGRVDILQTSTQNMSRSCIRVAAPIPHGRGALDL